jgi:hypothetical protein
MNKFDPSALLPAALLTLALLSAAVLPAQASAAPVGNARIVSVTSANSKVAQTLDYDTLYTETDWQRVMLPDEAVSVLGDLSALTLTCDLPANIKVALSTKSGPSGSIGLKITRSDSKRTVRQMGHFTLTNPATGASYTFAAMVTGGIG